MASLKITATAAIITLGATLWGADYGQDGSAERPQPQPQRQDPPARLRSEEEAPPARQDRPGRADDGQTEFRDRSDPVQGPPAGERRGGGGPFGGPGMGVETRWFQATDRDSDGKVTLDEFLQAQKDIFHRLDRNHDGVLTPDEFRRPGFGDEPGADSGGERRGGGGMGGPGMGGRGGTGIGGFGLGGPGMDIEAKWFDAADRDSDGQVTLDEFLKAQKAIYNRLDRNGDGVLTPEEFRRPDKGPEVPRWPAGAEHPGGLAGQAAPPDIETLVERLVARRDRDDDGALSLAEFGADRKALFESLDCNADGVVTACEVLNAVRQNPQALRLLGGGAMGRGRFREGAGPQGPGMGRGPGLSPTGVQDRTEGPDGRRRMGPPEGDAEERRGQREEGPFREGRPDQP